MRLRLAGCAGLTGPCAPLAALTRLTSLDLAWCWGLGGDGDGDGSTSAGTFAPLAALTRLEKLRLDGTRFADAAPLAPLTNLVTFDCSHAEIRSRNFDALSEFNLLGEFPGKISGIEEFREANPKCVIP